MRARKILKNMKAGKARKNVRAHKARKVNEPIRHIEHEHTKDT